MGVITIYKALGSVLLFFYNSFQSYGWAILIFGLLVKLIMLPFQMKSKHTMMRTTMLQPQMLELQKRCGSNQQKYQEEVARLYKEAKINPMSGCLWTLIPFPILIILYKIVRQPLSYLLFLGGEQIQTLTDVVVKLGFYEIPARMDAYAEMTVANVLHNHFAQVVADPGVSAFADKLLNINFDFIGLNLATKPKLFFWQGTDFSNPASWLPVVGLFLIPVISAGLTVLQTKVSQAMAPQQDPSTQRTTGFMNFFMPLMSLYICFIMPAAMGVYWIEQSVLGIIQEVILNRYYRKKLDSEMATFNEEQRKKNEELERKRAETERLRAEGKTHVNASTSKKRLAAQEKNAEEQRQAAIRAAERAAAGQDEELPDSQVGTRRYARGRAYVEERFQKEAQEKEKDEAEKAPESAAEAAQDHAEGEHREKAEPETAKPEETQQDTAPAAESPEGPDAGTGKE